MTVGRPVLLQVAEPFVPQVLKPGFNAHKTVKPMSLLKQKSKSLIQMLKVTDIMRAAAKPVIGRGRSWKTRSNLALNDVFLQFDTDNRNTLSLAKLKCMHDFYGEAYDERALKGLVAKYGRDDSVDFREFVLVMVHLQCDLGKFARFEDAVQCRDGDASTGRRASVLDDLMDRAEEACGETKKKPRATARRSSLPKVHVLSGVRTSAEAAEQCTNYMGLILAKVDTCTERRKIETETIHVKPAQKSPSKRHGTRRVVPVAPRPQTAPVSQAEFRRHQKSRSRPPRRSYEA